LSTVEISREEHLTNEQIQEMSEEFVGYMNSEDELTKVQAWEIGQKLHWHFSPLIKNTIFGSRNKMKVDGGVWQSTIDREGHDDMLSEGKVIFFEALHKYDPSSGVPFVGFIKSQIQYGVFNYLRDSNSLQDTVHSGGSLDEIMENGFDPKGADGVDMEDESTKNTLKLALRVAWNDLSQKQKDVLELMINKEYTLREAGKELGIHHTTVWEIRKGALNKMKKILKSFNK
jgi:RNA polymerase sigma factor (sigma-70 family)